ncbi:MAG: hypothetical protein BWK77_04620 [Verrucomicrobia bacterium A1]|nr:MAG: hypothetical protein BWK77_04620 [Verrucomicrobia bacterium A1]
MVTDLDGPLVRMADVSHVAIEHLVLEGSRKSALEIRDVCLDADDSGAIHMGRDWTWRGNAIRNNFFHHINSGSVHNNSAVYLDDMMCGTEVAGNVIYRVPRGHLVGGGRDNILENNIMVDCLVPVAIDNRAMGWAGYHVGTTMKDLLDKMPVRQAPWSVRYPRLAGIWEDEPAVPKGNVFRKNLMVRCGAPQFAAEVIRDGTIADNLETGDDPGFADLRRMDFNLRGDAAALQKVPGFRPVPFDRIGLRTDAYRPSLPPRRPVLNPAPHTFVDDIEIAIDLQRHASGTIRYTLDGREPGPTSPRYDKPLRLTRSTIVRARVVPDSGPDVAGAAAASGTYTATHLGPGAGIWLSDLTAVDVLAHGGLKRDLNYAGKGPLCLQGTPLEKGLLMCPETTEAGGRGHATWDLPGNLRRATRSGAPPSCNDPPPAGCGGHSEPDLPPRARIAFGPRSR